VFEETENIRNYALISACCRSKPVFFDVRASCRCGSLCTKNKILELSVKPRDNSALLHYAHRIARNSRLFWIKPVFRAAKRATTPRRPRQMAPSNSPQP